MGLPLFAKTLRLRPDIFGTRKFISHRRDRAVTGADVAFDALVE
jgi:hypothetical protein